MTRIPDGTALAGKRALVIGVANEHSIAYGCARVFRRLGAELALTYLDERAKPFVEPLARELGAAILAPCDVQREGDLEAVFWQVAETWAASISPCIPSPSHRRRIFRAGWSTVRPTASRSPWTCPATPSSAWRGSRRP